MILHSSHLSRKVSYILLIIVNGFCCSVASRRYLSITFHHSTVILILRVWGTLNLHFHLPRWALLILGHYHYLTHRLLYQGSYAQIYCRSPQSHTSPWAWLWVHDITTALTGIVSHLWCLLNDQNYLPSFPLDGLLLCLISCWTSYLLPDKLYCGKESRHRFNYILPYLLIFYFPSFSLPGSDDFSPFCIRLLTFSASLCIFNALLALTSQVLSTLGN